MSGRVQVEIDGRYQRRRQQKAEELEEEVGEAHGDITIFASWSKGRCETRWHELSLCTLMALTKVVA